MQRTAAPLILALLLVGCAGPAEGNAALAPGHAVRAEAVADTTAAVAAWEPTPPSPPWPPPGPPVYAATPGLSCTAPWVPVYLLFGTYDGARAADGMTVCWDQASASVYIRNDTDRLWLLTTPNARFARTPDVEELAYQTVSAAQRLPGIPIRVGAALYLNIAPAALQVRLDPAASAALTQYDGWVANARAKGISLSALILVKTNSDILKLIGGCLGTTYGIVTQALKNRPNATPQPADDVLKAAFSLSKSTTKCAKAYETFKESKSKAVAPYLALEDVELKVRTAAPEAALVTEIKEYPWARLVRMAARFHG